jgi:class 3 adenylate cyclase
MSQLPGGTVTFVFTDIEGSTRLLQELGDDDYGRVSGDHRRLVREAFGAHGGTEIDTQGDAFFFSFPRARDAVAAAVDAQRALHEHQWPGGREVLVRMGIHTGEPQLGDEGYLGIDVVRAARISAAGHGGQILVS